MWGRAESAYSSQNLSWTSAGQAQKATSASATVCFLVRVMDFQVPIEGPERDRRKFSAIAERLQILADLEENWDSYGGARLNPDALVAAIEVLESVIPASLPVPFITLNPRGGIHIVWSRPGREIEIDIDDYNQRSALFINEQEGTDTEEDTANASRIVNFIRS